MPDNEYPLVPPRIDETETTLTETEKVLRLHSEGDIVAEESSRREKGSNAEQRAVQHAGEPTEDGVELGRRAGQGAQEIHGSSSPLYTVISEV